MKKRYINLEEKEYIKRKRDSERIEKLKPLIDKAHKLLRHIPYEKRKTPPNN